jgi:hypothetical protein
MYMATRVAAVAIGLSLAAGMAVAAPDDKRGRDQNVGTQEQKQNGQDNHARTRRNNNQGPVANQGRRGSRDFGAQNNRQRGVERARTKYEGTRTVRRNNPIIDRTRNDRRDFGNNRSDRRWGDNNRRQQVNIQQYRRNYNSPRRFNVGVYRWRDGYSYRRYGYGQRLPQHFFLRNFWLTNFFAYGLFAPPEGYVWVRYGPDALLIDEYTGEIVQVRYNMFY